MRPRYSIRLIVLVSAGLAVFPGSSALRGAQEIAGDDASRPAQTTVAQTGGPAATAIGSANADEDHRVVYALPAARGTT